MGIFGKLFEKKQCSVCGGEIGLMGNRKLEDGNLCKTCARKLSPWFDDRRHSTVAQIEEQLAYREENREKLADFRVTRSFGEGRRVLLDEDAGLFLVTDETKPAKMEEENPDIMSFEDVTGCDPDIEEDRTELKREGKDGQEISYVPPRFRYEYDFYVTIRVRNPYFDSIRVKLNGSSVSIERQEAGNSGMRFGASSGFRPEQNGEYRQYQQMMDELCACLMDARQQKRDETARAAAPKAAVTCPWCGATTRPDAGGCCEYCGGAVNG